MRQNAYTVLVEQDETDAYIAKVPDLKSCHTDARFLPELLTRVRGAIALC